MCLHRTVARNCSALRIHWVELYLPMLCLHRCPELRRMTSTSSARARKRNDSRSSNVAPPHLLHWAGQHRLRISGMLALLIASRQRYVVDYASVASLARVLDLCWLHTVHDWMRLHSSCIWLCPCVFLPVSFLLFQCNEVLCVLSAKHLITRVCVVCR